MPVNEIADDNCILFIWVTYPNLLEGLDYVDGVLNTKLVLLLSKNK